MNKSLYFLFTCVILWCVVDLFQAGFTTSVLHLNLARSSSVVLPFPERTFLARLEGGCQVPLGAWAHIDDDESFEMVGCVCAVDGSTIIRERVAGDPQAPEELGEALAELLLAQGAGDLILAAR